MKSFSLVVNMIALFMVSLSVLALEVALDAYFHSAGMVPLCIRHRIYSSIWTWGARHTRNCRVLSTVLDGKYRIKDRNKGIRRLSRKVTVST
ncbi:MAG TPA: hypothetical protein GXX51_03230 [Firmicutes bacterium]|nr:hypothetical protein [Bacillota bacterium]